VKALSETVTPRVLVTLNAPDTGEWLKRSALLPTESICFTFKPSAWLAPPPRSPLPINETRVSVVRGAQE